MPKVGLSPSRIKNTKQTSRSLLSLTQGEVARRMNISQAAYSQIEKAKNPRVSTRKKVAEALGIDYRQLSA